MLNAYDIIRERAAKEIAKGSMSGSPSVSVSSYETAISLLSQIPDNEKNLQDYQQLHVTYSTMSYAYDELHQTDTALDALDKALTALNTYRKLRYGNDFLTKISEYASCDLDDAMYYARAGALFCSKHDTRKALPAYQKAISLFEPYDKLFKYFDSNPDDKLDYAESILRVGQLTGDKNPSIYYTAACYILKTCRPCERTDSLMLECENELANTTFGNLVRPNPFFSSRPTNLFKPADSSMRELGAEAAQQQSIDSALTRNNGIS